MDNFSFGADSLHGKPKEADIERREQGKAETLLKSSLRNELRN